MIRRWVTCPQVIPPSCPPRETGCEVQRAVRSGFRTLVGPVLQAERLHDLGQVTHRRSLAAVRDPHFRGGGKERSWYNLLRSRREQFRYCGVKDKRIASELVTADPGRSEPCALLRLRTRQPSRRRPRLYPRIPSLFRCVLQVACC